jgi:hypothetical protein
MKAQSSRILVQFRAVQLAPDAAGLGRERPACLETVIVCFSPFGPSEQTICYQPMLLRLRTHLGCPYVR